MSEREQGDSRSARALRAHGFRRCHRWWVKQDQFELIAYLAKQNEGELNEIKSKLGLIPRPATYDEHLSPKEQEIERAWRNR